MTRLLQNKKPLWHNSSFPEDVSSSSVSPVGSWTRDLLRRDFADQQAVTGTADILLSNGGVLYRLQRNGT